MKGLHRDKFPILTKKAYFNTCSIGPLAKSVKQKAVEYLTQWDEMGGVAWNTSDGWNYHVEKARKQFSEIIGANPKNIAFSFGNSVAVSSVTSALDMNAGDNIIFNELDFPAIPTHAMAQSEAGITSKIVKTNDGIAIDPKDYSNLIDDRTKLITACEVGSNTGFRIDRTELQEIASENEIPIFLDTYQSTGVIPINVESEGIDFLASGCLKWLVGGFGISFLYISDRWLEELEPASIGWMGVEDPFQDLFDRLRTSLERPSDARKFQYGTPYPVGAMTASAGMAIIQDIGMSKIYDHDMKLTQMIIDQAMDLNYEIQTPVDPEQRGSIVNIKVKRAGEVVQELQNRGFVLDMRSNGIRVAPHFFNNEEDIDRLFTAIKQII